MSRPWPLGHKLLEPWPTREWLILVNQPFIQFLLRTAGPGRKAALFSIHLSRLGARVHADVPVLFSIRGKIVPLSLSTVDELSTQNYRWLTRTVLWHFCFLFFLLGETIWAEKSNYLLMMKQDESKLRTERFFFFFPINLALTMPAGGWYLLKSNGVSSLACPRNSPMLWPWVKMMECVLAPTVFISSGRIFQPERAELSCCSWWVPLRGTKGCKLRRNMSILCGWSAHKAESMTKHLGLVYGDMRPRLQSTGTQSWKLFWMILFCLQREAVCTAQLGRRVASGTQSGQVVFVRLEFPFSVVGMKNGCIHFNQIHLGLTLPGRPQPGKEQF